MNFDRSPLWVYGHSFTQDLDPSVEWEWMPKLATQLEMPSWRTFGVGSSRLIDVYGDLSRLAPTVQQAESAWPWSPARRGVVVLQCETNDIICPAGPGPDTLPLNGKAVTNYQQTMEACLALLAAESRWDWNTAPGSGTWSSSTGPMYLVGANTWTETVGSWRELAVTVAASGTLGLIVWDVSGATVGAFQMTVDGVAVSNQVARSSAWQPIFSRRGGGYTHNVGPRLVLVSGITPGPHTVRVTKTDGPGRVYLDQLITLRAEPVPVLVTKDPPLVPGTHWATDSENMPNAVVNRKHLHGAINRAAVRYPNVRPVSLSSIRPEHYSADGVHLSQAGMDWQAGLLARALLDHTLTYEPDLLYTA